jgi:hypothetical protein
MWAGAGAICAAQTPSGWLIHDPDRPRPPVVEPAAQALPVPPPADARVLFDGTHLKHWRSAEGGPAPWVIRNGVLESVPDSGYLVSVDGFGDIQLHVEWAAPSQPSGTSQARGNSGVFLMGKYEVQVLDSYENLTYADGQAAAIYGQYPPLANVCRPPGEWQSYDIVFRRPRFDQQGDVRAPARITVIHNGVVVQVDRELWGPTSWLQNFAYQSHPDRLPLALQDHGNPVRYRNIWLRELPETDPPGPREPPVRPYYPLAPESLDRYVGSYGVEEQEEVPMVVERRDDALWVQVYGRRWLELVPAGPDEFALRFTAGKLVFRPGGQEAIERVEFHLSGSTRTAERLSDTTVDEVDEPPHR